MADSREAILARIRSSVASDRAADASAERAALPRNYRRAGTLDPEARLHMLIDRLRDYDANVVQSSATDVPQAIADILAQHQERKVIVADGLPLELLPGNCRFFPERDTDLQDLND
jgi:L-lactate utilization protein LutC